MPTDRKKIQKFLIYIAVTIASLIFYHIRDANETELLNSTFENTIFGIEGVTTSLSQYKEEPFGIFIQIKSLGLPRAASEYKPLLLSFICSNKDLKEKLLAGKSINLDMSAYDREEGNYVNMKITKGRCNYNF